MRAPLTCLVLAAALAACSPQVPTRVQAAHPGTSPSPATPAAASPTAPTPTASASAAPSAVPSVATVPSTVPTAPIAPAALAGLVLAPAAILSDNGNSIIANNGGGLVSNNGGGILGNNGGSYRLQSTSQVPVAGASVRLLDAGGKPVLGADGKPLTATTDAQGHYAFASAPTGHNLVLSTDLGKNGALTAIAAQGAGPQVNVDVVSTLTTTYILDQYVKSQADPVKTLDKLPATVEADTRSKAAAALTATPDALTPAKVVAAVDSLRKSNATFDQQMETVKKLLIVAGQSDLGNGLPADQVDLPGVKRMLWRHAGGLVIVTANRIWAMAADGTLVKLLDSPNDPIADAALDDQDRLLVLYGYAATAHETRFVAKRQEADGTLTLLGTVQEDPDSHWAPTLGILPGPAGGALVYTEIAPPAPAPGKLTEWSLAVGQAPVPRALPYAGPMGGSVGRRADGTLLFGYGMVMSTSYMLAPGAASLTPLNSNQFKPVSVTPDGQAFQADPTAHTLSQLNFDGTAQAVLSENSKVTSAFGTLVVCVAPDGTLYASFSDSGANNTPLTQVYHVVNGKSTVVAGRLPATNGVATTLPLHAPTSLAIGTNGAILINDGGTVLQVAADGTTSPWPGGALPAATQDKLIRTDAAGNIYVCHEVDLKPPGSNPGPDRLEKVTPAGVTSTVLTLPDRWSEIGSVAVGANGPLAVSAIHLDYVTSPNNLLFGPGVWTGLTGTPQFQPTEPAVGQGMPFPAMAVDPAGQAYVANKTQTWKLAADGTLTPYVPGAFSQGGAFAVDAKGRAYFARVVTVGAAGSGSTIERYAPDGTHDVVAGPGGRWFAGTGVDDGLGNVPDMVFAPDGALLLLDAGHKQVKRIPPDGL